MSVHKSPQSNHSPFIRLTPTTQRGLHSHRSTTPVISDDHRKRENMEWTLEWNRSDREMNGMRMSVDRIE